MTEQVISYPALERPTAFTQEELGWRPWLQAPDIDELTERQHVGLVDRARAASDYFRLLALDPDILGARTRTDKDIFYNTKEGLPRADREFAAAVTSRVNGCVFCASVHSRFASHFSDRHDDVQKLLDEGQHADLGPRWNAIAEAATALAQTPPQLTPAHLAALQAEGLDGLELSDVIHGSAFFNWANRLMLSIGEPEQKA